MTKSVFSRCYSLSAQRQFEEALEEGELEEAVKILEKFTPEDNQHQEKNRLITLVEGYRALTNKYREIEQKFSKEYGKLGSVEEVRESLNELSDLRSNATPF